MRLSQEKRLAHRSFFDNMRTIATFILFLSVIFGATAQEYILSTPTGKIYGELLMPEGDTTCPIVLIIAGSGPTNMDGNSLGTDYKSNSLRYLAEELAKRGIATLRYDKRGIGKSREAQASEENLRFEHYIDDAAAWADTLFKDGRFTKVIIAGHSEGSLIGMVAAQKSNNIKAFVSIAGCGSPAHQIIEEQMSKQPQQIRDEVAKINKELCEGRTVENVPSYLASLYRKSVQPYLISWFRYDPSKEIAKLKIPVLILQGDKDIQVGVKEAQKLYMARIFSSFYIIENMNHVLKDCDSDNTLMQLETYKNPDLPIKSELVEHITRFIKQ